jgi:SSS family solute:Na+ symporter
MTAMTALDWLEMFLPAALALAVVLYARRFMASVADFMTGGRAAGRYLISMSRSEMGWGAVMVVAIFQVFYQSGFTTMWWQQFAVPAGLIVSMTGFVYYRYRQTRAMTLAQFFEMRYSRRFRIFTGALGFFAGIMNFGIVPCVGARFFVSFLELPQTVHLFSLEVPTYLLFMAGFLTLSSLLAISGGQVTILAGGCVQGVLSQVAILVAVFSLLPLFPWHEAHDVLLHQPAAHSLVNPFDSFATADFNLWWVLMSLFLNQVYGTMAWQNNHAFNASGATPHETRMGNFLTNWITGVQLMVITLLALFTFTFLHHPAHAAAAAPVQEALAQFTDPTVREQARLPLSLAYLLPHGIKGLIGAVILMGIVTGDGIHLHSWSSIFVQDVLMPRRSRFLPVGQHLAWLRRSIAGVAAFAFLFGALFRQTEYVMMWLQITMVIFVGGAGSAIIGGLYWSRGTTTGAWAGMLTGSLLSVGGIAVRILDPQFPCNGTEIAFAAALGAIAVYCLTSLLTCRERHNMDALLHRGSYAVETEPGAAAAPPARAFSPSKIVGIDDAFTGSDRWVALGIFWWSLGWFLVMLTGTIVEFFHPFPEETWAAYWRWASVRIPLAAVGLTCLWFVTAGVRDLFAFFAHLRRRHVDIHDDGTVAPQGQDAPEDSLAGQP